MRTMYHVCNMLSCMKVNRFYTIPRRSIRSKGQMTQEKRFRLKIGEKFPRVRTEHERAMVEHRHVSAIRGVQSYRSGDSTIKP